MRGQGVVGVTASVIAPVIPKVVAGGHGGFGQAERLRRPPPMPALGLECPSAADPVYALSAVDKSGRVTDRSIVQVLGWEPGTRLDIREQRGIIVVSSAANGVHCISQRAFLKLPLTVRRWCRIEAGDKVLVAADRSVGVLVVHSMAAVHAVLADVHAAALRGDAV